MKTRIIILFLILFLFFNVVQGQAETLVADIQRLEVEDKLFVPQDKADEVWAFLENKYIKDQKHLQSFDPAFTSYLNLEEFWDTYFDTPTFQVYEQLNGVRYRTRFNLTNPDAEKSGRELMQIKQNGINNNPLSRGEVKFTIAPPDKPKDPDDSYGMLHLVKPKERVDFKAKLKEMGLDPYFMQAVLTVHDLRSRIYINQGVQPFLSISFDRVDSQMWWATINFIEIEPELNEATYTEANQKTRQYMEKVLGQVVAEIRTEFPFIKQDLTPKYSKAFNALKEKLPIMTFLFRANMHGTDGMALALASFVVILGFLFYFLVLQCKKIFSHKKPKKGI